MNTTQAGDRVENLAVYLSPADNCEGPLLYYLPGVKQPVISTANGFPALRSTL